MKKIIKKTLFITSSLISTFANLHKMLISAIKPSLDREWSDDQKILPYAKINASNLTIHNIRNFNYCSINNYDTNYYDKTYDLNKLKSVWFMVEPFSGHKGAAHTLMSFGFGNGEYVAISIEIRKKKGETFSALKGLFRQYELMYVVADERDVIKLRSNFRKDKVYLYPIKASPEKTRAFFLSMISRVNKLAVKPEFYNTLTSTCATNIVRHVNEIVPGRIPKLRMTILFPENSDRLAYELGLIDTNLSFEKTREKHLINKRALEFADAPDFSEKIRGQD